MYVVLQLMFLISYGSQDGVYLVWRASHVLDWFIPAYDEYRSWGPCLSSHAKVDLGYWLPESTFLDLDHNSVPLILTGKYIGFQIQIERL